MIICHWYDDRQALFPFPYLSHFSINDECLKSGLTQRRTESLLESQLIFSTRWIPFPPFYKLFNYHIASPPLYTVTRHISIVLIRQFFKACICLHFMFSYNLGIFVQALLLLAYPFQSDLDHVSTTLLNSTQLYSLQPDLAARVSTLISNPVKLLMCFFHHSSPPPNNPHPIPPLQPH